MTNPTLKIGDGNWAYKEDNLLGYAVSPVNNKFLPREMTFTRASDGTRVNEDGLVENMPFNLLQQSNTFSTTWTTSNASITGGQSGYDGSSDAWLLTANSTSNIYIYQNNSTNSVVTFSVYAKSNTANFLELVSIGGGGANPRAWFNLSTGSVGTSYNVIDTKIEIITNGWYRCSITLNESITQYRIYASDSDNSTTITNGNNIYIQDAQLNLGSTAKPYFPTTNRQDVPRIDYSSGTGALLLEPQRTNLITYSEQFDNAAWSKTRTSVTANATTAPNMTATADKIVEDTTASASHFIRGGTYSVISGTSYTFSVYVKSTERQFGFNFDPSTGADSPAIFNLVSGTVVSSGSFTTSITNVGNGWYRCTGTFTSSATTTSYVYVRLADSGSTVYTGDGTSGIYLWGAQLEASSYATSYIPTTSATVTRLADTCYKTGVADWIGQTEGTLFVDFIYKTSDQTRVSISDGSSTNWIFIGIPDSSTHSRLYIRTNGTVQVDTSSNLLGIFTSGQRYKIALAYKSGDWAIAVNGTIKTSGSQTFSPSAAFNTIVLTGNSSAASSQLGLNQMNHATLYKTRLSNSELAALTTI